MKEDQKRRPKQKWIAFDFYDCQSAPGQIDLQRGEEVEEILGDVNGWTKVRNKKGEEGSVPTKKLGKHNYLLFPCFRNKLFILYYTIF